VMTGLGAIFDLPVLMYIALWALAIASTVTVVQRVWVVRKQALSEAALLFPHD
jgi:CDP-diacylglycerol--glycerol-3-phosphate 3-phosphatidyltransferase